MMERYHVSQVQPAVVRMVGIIMLLRASGRLSHSGLGHRMTTSGHHLNHSSTQYVIYVFIG